jgi:hypothetical protein
MTFICIEIKYIWQFVTVGNKFCIIFRLTNFFLVIPQRGFHVKLKSTKNDPHYCRQTICSITQRRFLLQHEKFIITHERLYII